MGEKKTFATNDAKTNEYQYLKREKTKHLSRYCITKDTDTANKQDEKMFHIIRHQPNAN